MRRVAIASLVLGSLAVTAAAGGWQELDGQPAPEFTASQWLHASEGTPSKKSLKGKVWLLNFIGIH